MSRGLLIVVSGPSGSGKGTALELFMKQYPNAVYSVSATTRARRDYEIHGVHYWFVSRDEFEEMIKNDEFLEYATYLGNYYGTPSARVREQLDAGRDVILEIDIQGGLQIKQKCPDALMVFFAPSSVETLEQRLRLRGTEDEETILRRVEKAREELKFEPLYDCRVVNDDLNTAVLQLISFVEGRKLQ